MKKWIKKRIIWIILVSFVATGGFGKPAHAAATELYYTSLYLDANLIAYYRLEDVNDNEDSGTDYNLTNLNSVGFNAAKFNNGADFGTANTNKYLYNNAGLGWSANALTISYWVKVRTEPATNAYYQLVQNQRTSDDIALRTAYKDTSGTKYLQITFVKRGVVQTDLNYPTTLGTSDFHHVVMWWDDTTMKLYLDGSLATSTAASGNGTTNFNNCFGIGSFNGDNCTPTAGTYASVIIDDLAVFDRTLTEQEITDIYSGTSTPATTADIANIIFFE